MTLLVDTSALLSQADRRSETHRDVVRILRSERGTLVVPAFVAAESEYLIHWRLGTEAELAFLADLGAGTYEVPTLTQGELRLAGELVGRHRDLRIGLTDASLVVLAKRLDTTRVLTLDVRDFRALTPLQGGHFMILPADA